MENKNKFSILAVTFTVFYLLIGQFMMSDTYSTIPNILFWTTDIIYLGCMGVSAIVGVIGIRKIYKVEQKIKWSLFLLTLFNTCVVIVNLATMIFPETFINYK